MFCVLNNRIKENLLTLIKNNIITDEYYNNDDEEISEEDNVQTKAYLDCL